MITCFIQYQIDPEKIAEFEIYANRWIDLVSRYRGHHHGYFLPHEGSSDYAIALFSFPTLAAYEAYRTASARDADCQVTYDLAAQSACIRRYERQFLRPLRPECSVIKSE